MSTLSKNLVLQNVHRVRRPGLGYVYKGTISVAALHKALRDGDIAYSLKYQRGTKDPHLQVDPDLLLPIHTKELDINIGRAQQMAVKYLIARAGNDYALYNPDIIWNARADEDVPVPEYDPSRHELRIHSRISIPDSAHRHYAYYLLAVWKKDPKQIPAKVVMEDESGDAVDRNKIEELLVGFNPADDEDSCTFVEIFNLTKEAEGQLFVEYNELGKKPSNAASIDMFESRTPSTRFVAALMTTSPIFARDEIETRSNTIGSKSRKLTTNATLASAIRPFAKRLRELEEGDDKTGYGDLIHFFSDFYKEWSDHYPAFKPNSSAEERNALRETSFAMSNIMFFPMFRLAFELWEHYRRNGIKWRTDKGWKDALARLAGNVSGKKYRIMARNYAGDAKKGIPAVEGNPDWEGKILIRTFDSNGKPTGWSLSSTRQTRDAAFHYLVDQSGLAEKLRRPTSKVAA